MDPTALETDPDETPSTLLRAPEAPDPAALLTQAGLPFQRGAAEGLWVTSLLLAAQGRETVALFAKPKGLRADLRAVAAALALPRLGLARWSEPRWTLGQTAATLSPFGLMSAEGRSLAVALDERLMAAPRLGFPGLRAAERIWLTPDALMAFLASLGLAPKIGRFILE